MKKYILFALFSLGHKDGKTYVISRTSVWLALSPFFLSYMIGKRVLVGLMEFFFDAFNFGTPNTWCDESIERFKKRNLKSKISLIQELL